MFNIKSFFKSRRHLDVVKLKLILTFSRLLLRAVLSSECIKMRKIILVIKRLNCLKCLKVLDSLDKIESFKFVFVLIFPRVTVQLLTKFVFVCLVWIVYLSVFPVYCECAIGLTVSRRFAVATFFFLYYV